jgi:hypothetical protein
MDNEIVRSEIDEIRSLRRQAAVWRWCLTLVVLATIVTCISLLVAAGRGLATEGATRDAFTKQLNARLQRDVVPSLQDIGNQALKRVDLTTQLKKLNARAPEVANRSLKELHTLGTDLQKDAQTTLSAQLATVVNGRKAAIGKEFPDITGDDLQNFVSALAEETQNQVGDVTATLFSKHLAVMQDMATDIEAIKAAEGPSAQADMPTWDMAFMIIDVARGDFMTNTGAAPAAPKAPKAGKGK